MKCQIPQISWHNRDPVLSVDFQFTKNSIRRIATAGTDTHVLIWLLTVSNGSNVNLEFVADLNRHSKTVNVVRFSPNGEILASADDEAAIILWKQQTRIDGDIFVDDDNSTNKENWTPLKILRGHIDDICDLCWSPDSLFLITGSVDNTAITWDVTKGKNLGLLSDHKGFVQGVAWDPKGQFLATLCSDRTLRIYNISNKKLLHRVQKAVLPSSNSKEPQENVPKATRIFYDDTLKSFCRRLCFSSDGELLIVPSGIIEEVEGKFSNATYVFTRNSLNKPALYLPTGDKFTLAARCCPVLFQIRKAAKNSAITTNNESSIEESENKSLFCLPYRIVYAVATQDSILFYDSQQTMPFAKVSNIHYTRLSDLSWAPDGCILMASSTDGYCSFVLFSEGELGVPYTPPQSTPVAETEEKKEPQNKRSDPVVLAKEETPGLDWALVLEPSTDLPEGSTLFKAHPTVETICKLADNLMETAIEVCPNIVPKVESKNEIKDKSVKIDEVIVEQVPPVTSNKEVPPKSSKNSKTPRRIQLVTLSSSLNK